MRSSLLTSALLCLALLLAACGGAPTAPATSSAPAASSAASLESPIASVAAATAASTAAAPASVATKPVVSTLTIKLRPGICWSDGTELTAQDFVGGYDILWAQGDSIWESLSDVVAPDATTLAFQLATPPSPGDLRTFLRSVQTGSRSQYGALMDRARALRQQGAALESAEVKQLVADLEAFQPEDAVTYGPFKIDPASVTEAQMELVKHAQGFRAERIDFEKLVIYYGETAASTPLMLAGELDYSSHGYTPSDIAAFEQQPNVQIIRGPTGTGPAIWFNESIAPLDRKELRQAFAYVIDRAENAQVALGEAGKPVQYMAGFSDLLVPQWLSEATQARLNRYEKDLAKAEALLTGIGFRKGDDGVWTDDTGKPLAFELAVPSDFADWLGAAENAAQQLNAFGIKVTVRGYPSSERANTLKEAQYQLLVDFGMLSTPPHPNSAFRFYMTDAFFNANNPAAADGPKGLNWPWQQRTPDGAEIDVKQYVEQSAQGIDADAQKQYVEPLALIYNDQLPVLALFERYSNDPINVGARVTGWLPLDDKIYQNNQGADNYIAIQMLDGTLKAAPTGDRSFRTSYPYPQPPNYSFNYFTANSLEQNVGYPSYNLLYPPLFWYMTADAQYVPAVAESYELKNVP
jgi:peptide/nickel transport system substrate-binding protein